VLKFSNKPIISHLVFLFSITITTLTIIPALFPSLYSSLHRESIITSVDQFDFNINPLEPGLFFIPIIGTGVLVLVISIIIKFKVIKVRSIDLSKKYSYISIIIILSIFTILSYEDVTEPEVHEDWVFLKEGLMKWPPEKIVYEHHVKMFLLSSSFIIFGNYKVIPFLGSMALIVMTYLLTNKITDSRLAGVIAAVIILQSNLFLSFSTTAVYSNFWVLFYIISLFMVVHKTWFLYPITYAMSIFSKILSITFIPITIFFVLNAEISIKKKIISLLSLGILISVGIIFMNEIGMESTTDLNGFWNGFVSFSYQMRYDGLVVVFLIPIVTGLYLISKKNQYANSVSIMISSVLLVGPLLLAFTNVTTQPYRFIPLIVFCAIGIGMILANQKEKVRQVSKNSR